MKMTDKLVTIGTFVYSLRAYLTKGRLESEGIKCYLLNENFRYGIHLNLEDGLELRVKQEDEERARAILNQIEQEFGKEATTDFEVDVKKILVPIDFSDHSINACYYAIGLAAIFKAEIRLFHSYYLPVLDSSMMESSTLISTTIDEHISNIKENAENNILHLQKKLEAQLKQQNITNVQIEYNLSTGFANDEIYREYKEYKPDLIIMGTGARNEETKKIHGSISAEIVEHVKVPVLTIPSIPGYKDISSLKRIVYVTNFDESDFRAIHKLLYLISPFKMEVFCIHVASGLNEKWDEIKLEGLREHFKKAYIGPEINVEIIKSDNPVLAIDEYIKQNNIDVVAMVSHKRNFFSRIFNPSIIKKIMIHGHTPMLVFH